jgi:hypothetical protein
MLNLVCVTDMGRSIPGYATIRAPSSSDDRIPMASDSCFVGEHEIEDRPHNFDFRPVGLQRRGRGVMAVAVRVWTPQQLNVLVCGV